MKIKSIYQYKAFEGPTGVEAVKDVDEKKLIVTGYYAAFDNVDHGNDLIEQPAFNKTVAERGPNGSDDIRFLYQHDSFNPIGLPKVLKADQYGLYHESEISNTSLGRDTAILIRDKVLKKFSIGYRVVKEEQVNGVNRLKEIHLYEGSIVTFPMNEAANLTGIKSMGLARVKAEIEEKENYCRKTTVSDETIKLMYIYIKQLQQAALDLETTEPPESTQPDGLINVVKQATLVQIIQSFTNSLNF